MTSPASIRRRMLAALLWVSVAWGVVAPLIVVLTIRHEIHELLDDTLRASAEALSGVLQGTLPLGSLPHGPGGATISPAGDYVRGRFAWQLVGPGAEVQFHSPQAPETPLMPVPTLGLADSALGWRVLGVAIGPQGHVLYVAQTLGERTEALRDTALNTMMASLSVWAVCVVGLLRRMRSELAEIDRLVADVQAHDPLDPTKTLPPVTRDELRPIRDAIDDLGVRLAARVRNERAFTAHAAHALRTPLAGMDAQLAVALRECAPAQQPRLRRVREAARRFAQVVSALLTLFRSGAELRRQPVDVAALLTRMPVAGLEVRLAEPPEEGWPVTPEADPDLLAAALANLLDNAVRHGARSVEVGVDVLPVGGWRLWVSDDGPGLTPERLHDLQMALDREDYSALSGLGLILTDLIARAHGGRLRLAPGQADGGTGLRVEMTLLTRMPEERFTRARTSPPPAAAARGWGR